MVIVIILDTLTSSERSKISLFFVAKVFLSFVAETGRAHLGRGLVFSATTIGK